MLTQTFRRFIDSERTGGGMLVLCSILALAIANSAAGPDYLNWWETPLGGMSLRLWINDGLMAVFFLLIGLELEREFYTGELSDRHTAGLPVALALGGMLMPAVIHLSLNSGTPTQNGFGIPVATDIAFALGVLALLGERVPSTLKVLIVAFAAIDDLGAVLLIALFYTTDLATGYLLLSLATWGLLCVLNRHLRVTSLVPYVAGGILCWCLMLKSGVHATVAGVLLAFAIPFSPASPGKTSPSHRLEKFLQKPVAFLVLPIFALANTGIILVSGSLPHLMGANGIGILAGLLLGKPAGIAFFGYVAVRSGVCRLPPGITWSHVVGAGLLGGIGYTMSIFVTNLAFAGNDELVSSSKLAVFCASLLAGVFGAAWFAAVTKSSGTRQRRDVTVAGDSCG